MEKIEIRKVPVIRTFANNYTFGMEGLIFNTRDISVEEVKTLPNVYLHPTVKPIEDEIYALWGDSSQWNKFYRSAVESYCTRKAVDKYGMPEYDDRAAWKKLNKYTEELANNFIPWYDE